MRFFLVKGSTKVIKCKRKKNVIKGQSIISQLSYKKGILVRFNRYGQAFFEKFPSEITKNLRDHLHFTIYFYYYEVLSFKNAFLYGR